MIVNQLPKLLFTDCFSSPSQVNSSQTKPQIIVALALPVAGIGIKSNPDASDGRALVAGVNHAAVTADIRAVVVGWFAMNREQFFSDFVRMFIEEAVKNDCVRVVVRRASPFFPPVLEKRTRRWSSENQE